MFFSLNRVENHPLYQFQIVLREFFEQCSNAPELDWLVFPQWFQNLLENYGPTKERFERVFEIISNYQEEKRLHVLEIFDLINNVEELCTNRDLAAEYIEDTDENLQELKKLFVKLFEETLKKVGLFENNIDDSINNHFLLFRELNKVCPFCGIEKYSDIGISPRDSYDHYLSEKDYFLAGVNFNNLIPMCFRCNSGGNKGQKDILYNNQGNEKTRRLAYYPYSNVSGVQIQIEYFRDLDSKDIERFEATMIPNDENDVEKIETWDDVFNITSRLNARIKSQQENWMEAFLELAFPDACNEDALRNAARLRANQLSEKIQTRSEAVLESAFLNFLADTEHEYLLTGYCDLSRDIAQKTEILRTRLLDSIV